MANRKLPIVSVIPAGTQRYRRWQIADERHRIWTGERFSESSGLVYASHNLAAIDAESILRSSVGAVPSRNYEAPAVVEVLGQSAIPQAVVAHFLSKAIRLFHNRSEHGYGPDGSVVLLHIDWARMKPLTAPTDPAGPTPTS